MNTNNTNEKLLIYLDEFRSLLRDYDSNVITMSKFCEIINDKADKIVSVNAELLDALKVCYKALCTYGNHPIIEKQIQNAINKATE